MFLKNYVELNALYIFENPNNLLENYKMLIFPSNKVEQICAKFKMGKIY